MTDFDFKNSDAWIDKDRYPDMTLQDVVVIQERLTWPWWKRVLVSHARYKRFVNRSCTR